MLRASLSTPRLSRIRSALVAGRDGETHQNTMTTPNKNGQGHCALEPLIIPCECGSDQANWRGDRYGLRMYLCPDCASHYPELLAAESWGRACDSGNPPQVLPRMGW